MVKKNKALFLDRDGVINKMFYNTKLGTVDTPLSSSQVEFIPGIFEFLKTAKKRGYLLILISSQPGIGIKKLSKKNFLKIKKKISETLKRKSVQFDREYYCLHHPFATIKKYRTNCNCRKPGTALIDKAIKDLDIEVKKSWLVGDGIFDIMAGAKVGIKTILLANVNEAEYLRVLEERLRGIKPDHLVKNLKEAEKILCQD
ncbi:MAG: HAD-IIIA family hydrolase [Patescibacteria group bacterium]|nr:HAD-IIIA family hydrolase [Patescibacteria group bacterium]